MFAQSGDVAPRSHELEIPGTVAGVTVEHGATQLVVADDEALVDATAFVAQDQSFGSLRDCEITRSIQFDASDLELRSRQRSTVSGHADLGEMHRTDARLLPQRRHQAEGAVA